MQDFRNGQDSGGGTNAREPRDGHGQEHQPVLSALHLTPLSYKQNCVGVGGRDTSALGRLTRNS